MTACGGWVDGLFLQPMEFNSKTRLHICQRGTNMWPIGGGGMDDDGVEGVGLKSKEDWLHNYRFTSS